MTAKKKRGRPPKLTSQQLEMARRYESVWHYEFAQLAEYRQKRIIEDPHGISAAELAKKVARVAENDDKFDKIEAGDSDDKYI